VTKQRQHSPSDCAHCRRNREASTQLYDRPAWVQDAVFYQIFPDRFAKSDRVRKPINLEPWDAPPTFHGYKGGDLLGVAEHLDWLVDLGVTAIYFNPIFRSASNHRYHTHDYYRVDPILGTDEDFEELLAACHERGIRVILDGVFNHSSRGFFRFHDVLENGEQSPYVGWFHINGFPLNPYDMDEPANYEAWWGMRALPKFNTDNAEARDYLMGVGEYWAKRGIDGWRLDVPEEIHTEGFWEEFRERTRAINPDLYIVGEIWSEAGAFINDGTRFDGTMNYPFTSATIAFTVGDRLDTSTIMDNPHYNVAPALDASGYRQRIEQLLGHYPEAAMMSNLNLLDSHDTARILSIASGDDDAVVLALALLLTFPGAPSIYYGSEIGLEGGLDPDCRRSFPWEHEGEWNQRILAATKDLIALRNQHPALRSPAYNILWPPDDGDGAMSFAVERSEGDDRLIVVVNAGRERESHSVNRQQLRFGSADLVWGSGDLTPGENHTTISIPPRSAAIWTLSP
jgi:cyclomaltodextrinase